MSSTSGLPSMANTSPPPPPFIIVQLNAKDLIEETVELISTARGELRSLGETVNERLNGTLENIGYDIEKIVRNVEGITAGINKQIGDYSHPFLFTLILTVFLLILVVLLFLLCLKTHRQYKKRHPMQPTPKDTNGRFRQLSRRFKSWRREMLSRRSRTDGMLESNSGGRLAEETSPTLTFARAPPPPIPHHHLHSQQYRSPTVGNYRPAPQAEGQSSPSTLPSKRTSDSLDTLV